MMHRHAFSLVELSIVLVILGLLVGGVLSGQSLIRASELRKYGTFQDRYRTAVLSFRDKYMGLPGDLTNATQFWGAKTPASCLNNSGAAVVAATGTCDGDGNGQILYTPAANEESDRVFEQLSRAQLIEGFYSYSNPGLSIAASIGVELPALGIHSAAAMITYSAVHGTSANFVRFASYSSTTSTLAGGVMTPAEAYSLDTKLDDGKAGTGAMLGHYNVSDLAVVAVRCANDSNSPTAAYNVQYSEPTCITFFKL